MGKQEPFKWRKAKPSTPDPKPQPKPAPARPAPQRVEPAAKVQETPAASAATAAKVQETPAADAATAASPRPSHGQIAVLAYEIWEARGWPDGADREHWIEAERQLLGESH